MENPRSLSEIYLCKQNICWIDDAENESFTVTKLLWHKCNSIVHSIVCSKKRGAAHVIVLRIWFIENGVEALAMGTTEGACTFEFKWISNSRHMASWIEQEHWQFYAKTTYFWQREHVAQSEHGADFVLWRLAPHEQFNSWFMTKYNQILRGAL